MFIDIYRDNETFQYETSSIIFMSPTAMPITSQLDTEIAKAVEDICAQTPTIVRDSQVS